MRHRHARHRHTTSDGECRFGMSRNPATSPRGALLTPTRKIPLTKDPPHRTGKANMEEGREKVGEGPQKWKLDN